MFVDDFRDWPYSSYHYFRNPDLTGLEIKREEVLEWFGGNIDAFEQIHSVEVNEEEVQGLLGDDEY